jgi:hypothetical protein
LTPSRRFRTPRPGGLYALAFGVSNLLGAVRLGLGRPDVADAALEHAMSAIQVWDRARRRGFWARRAFAEDLRTCLTELVLAAELIARVLHDLQPHASEATREAVDVAPFTLATTRDALAVRRPGMSAGDILDSVALNLRLLVDTCDGLRRGLEAALIQWERGAE